MHLIILQYLGVSPKEENNAFLTFVIPREKEGLLKVHNKKLLAIMQFLSLVSLDIFCCNDFIR